MSASASSSKAPPSRPSTSTRQPTSQQIEETTRNVRQQLRQLRLDDMASLAQQQQIQSGNPIIDEQIGWISLSISNYFYFLNYLVTTWGDIAKK